MSFTDLERLERVGNVQVIVDVEKDEVVSLKDFLPHTYNRLETTIKNFDNLRAGIAWRKEEYKKMLDSNRDEDGIILSKSRRLVIDNLYNMMIALESYYTNENDPIIKDKSNVDE